MLTVETIVTCAEASPNAMIEVFLAHGLHCNKYLIDHALTDSLTISELSLNYTYRSTKLSDDDFLKMYSTSCFLELCIVEVDHMPTKHPKRPSGLGEVTEVKKPKPS